MKLFGIKQGINCNNTEYQRVKLKFRYCEKAEQFEKISDFFLKLLMPCPFTGPKMFCAGPNFFEPAQKFIYILCQSQTFCARQKDDLHSVKLVFVPAQKFLKRH